MVGVQASEALEKFVGFFESLKKLGVKVWVNRQEKEIMIKGRIGHADMGPANMNKILISQNEYDIEYIKSDKFTSILIWKYVNGKRELLDAISVDGAVMVRYSHSYLSIRYSEIYGIRNDIVYVDGFDEVVKAISGAGFRVEYFPEKREIRIKGEIEEVFSFIDPKVQTVLSSGNSELVVLRDSNEYRLKLLTGYSDVEYVLGDAEQVMVELDGHDLIIRHSAVEIKSY